MDKILADIYLFKDDNGYTRRICEICSLVAIKTSKWRQRHSSVVFIVELEQVNAIWNNPGSKMTVRNIFIQKLAQ